jgi:hypothetical protein
MRPKTNRISETKNVIQSQNHGQKSTLIGNSKLEIRNSKIETRKSKLESREQRI